MITLLSFFSFFLGVLPPTPLALFMFILISQNLSLFLKGIFRFSQFILLSLNNKTYSLFVCHRYSTPISLTQIIQLATLKEAPAVLSIVSDSPLVNLKIIGQARIRKVIAFSNTYYFSSNSSLQLMLAVVTIKSKLMYLIISNKYQIWVCSLLGN